MKNRKTDALPAMMGFLAGVLTKCSLSKRLFNCNPLSVYPQVEHIRWIELPKNLINFNGKCSINVVLVLIYIY